MWFLLDSTISDTKAVSFLTRGESDTESMLSHSDTQRWIYSVKHPHHTVRFPQLHVHEHHEAPAEPPHQKHGDLHAVDDQVVQHPEVQAPVP